VLKLLLNVSDISTASLLRGFVELDDGWIAPFNGFQYKMNVKKRTWIDSRKICQSWGGDHIVYGFRDDNVRQ